MWFNGEKILTAATAKTHIMTAGMPCSNQAEICCDKIAAHVINIQTVTDGKSLRMTRG